MKKSLLIILGLAALAGAFTLALLSGFVQLRPVVVARVDLAAGTRLTAEIIEVQKRPRVAIPEGSLTSLEEAAGKVLTTSRVAGDVITAYVAGESGASAGIPSELAEGSVAIAVKIDQATGLAGMVRPGQRVSVIAIIDPQAIQHESSFSNALITNPLEVPPVEGPLPTPTSTPTPQPPLSPVASITITGLRVLVVPQSFRYEELPATTGEDAMFADARTSQASQEGSVILLEAPLQAVQIAPGLSASPAELLALLNDVATIHLALEPAEGLSIQVSSLQPVDLAKLYEKITGYDLNR